MSEELFVFALGMICFGCFFLFWESVFFLYE